MSSFTSHARPLSPPPVYGASGLTSGLKPYLELPHLISLAWLAYPILSLLFIAFRLQLSSASTQDAVESAKLNLVASCKAAEKAATTAASMPQFLAAATNAQIADGVNATMEGARKALVLALTVMEGIINFIVDLYRSTLLCFVELVVRGGLGILIAAVKEVRAWPYPIPYYVSDFARSSTTLSITLSASSVSRSRTTSERSTAPSSPPSTASTRSTPLRTSRRPSSTSPASTASRTCSSRVASRSRW
jgi:hypothetical protein